MGQQLRLNLLMGVIWLSAAVTLLVFALQGKTVAGLDPDRAYLIIVFGLVLALYNAARWWSGRGGKPTAPPPKRVLPGAQREYLPEFDFHNQPQPDANPPPDRST